MPTIPELITEAHVLVDQGKFDEASALCYAALNINPHSAQALNCLGWFYVAKSAALDQVGLLLPAWECYCRAYELGPTPQLLSNMAYVARLRQMTDIECTLLLRAIAMIEYEFPSLSSSLG